MTAIARVIALYLPQFHPIPENDEWWEKGFTEWTNVTKARPLFRGHYQPHLPSELGFYDLRVPETRMAQAELAREHLIEGFCYWHYWFAGQRLIERPFNEVLRSGEPRYPFCLAWANQTWTGIWHGCPDRILVEQTYPGMKDHEAHFFTLLEAFSDNRYITVDGKPLFIIYKPQDLPDTPRVIDYWRTLATRAGLKGLYIVGQAYDSWNPHESGFDASFNPHLPSPYKSFTWRAPFNKVVFNYRRIFNRPVVYRYRDVVDKLVDTPVRGVKSFPCILPNWDNTPRSGFRGIVLHDSTPELFRRQVRKAKDLLGGYRDEEKLIFVKSWNEWAEGNHLEPDQRYGRGYLEVLRQEIMGTC